MSGLPEFLWSVGEESSDPWSVKDGQPYRIDQLDYSGHMRHQQADLQSIADLGVRHVRYGMPWRLTETQPGLYDWSLWDRALEACERAGLVPLIDMLHFGQPDFCRGYADPAWVDHFVRYVEAFLARYPQARYFTPVNEPAWTAITAGYLGAWNDRLASEPDFARILANITLANLEALARIDADRDNVWVSAETFNIPIALSPDLQAEVERRRYLGWLVWDLHLGLEPREEGAEFLGAVDPETLQRIKALARRDRLIAGHDIYPHNFQFFGGEAPALSIRERVALYERDARDWYQRYQVPFWISETSNFGLPIAEQEQWLDELLAAVGRMRADGLPMVGLCWYSRGDQYDWQTLLVEPTGQVTEVGLFDTARSPRPVAKTFADHVRRGTPI
ncbi:family 1 glycosylhydrolase [Pseudohalioglobus sediminis]|uniref:Family 1 glycosylhydrolase n=1 Tax=Pseudohalioglobus sediminis TaxID=2606449 RepID=A0A5B0X1F2_9GAMM|nr:family 1 glycosylhydrolase [Pseudohalioglobus sediminis]KAA1192495.1 family 1 glycosylhydrolase [Pseudohalioglobus sediminis]